MGQGSRAIVPKHNVGLNHDNQLATTLARQPSKWIKR
jgi:hypothetical protein